MLQCCVTTKFPMKRLNASTSDPIRYISLADNRQRVRFEVCSRGLRRKHTLATLMPLMYLGSGSMSFRVCSFCFSRELAFLSLMAAFEKLLGEKMALASCLKVRISESILLSCAASLYFCTDIAPVRIGVTLFPSARRTFSLVRAGASLSAVAGSAECAIMLTLISPREGSDNIMREYSMELVQLPLQTEPCRLIGRTGRLCIKYALPCSVSAIINTGMMYKSNILSAGWPEALQRAEKQNTVDTSARRFLTQNMCLKD